jgi:hypothetical protein
VKKIYLAAMMSVLVAVPALAEQAAAPAVVPVRGKVLLAAGGARLGPVYGVGADGSAQLIIDGRMISIPANTLSMTDGKLTTSLSKKDVNSIRYSLRSESGSPAPVRAKDDSHWRRRAGLSVPGV